MNSRTQGLDAYLTKPQPDTEDELWCPICDVPSEECIQPEGEEQEDGDGAWMFVYWVEGHAAQWITYREKARDAALDFLSECAHDREETQGD